MSIRLFTILGALTIAVTTLEARTSRVPPTVARICQAPTIPLP